MQLQLPAQLRLPTWAVQQRIYRLCAQIQEQKEGWISQSCCGDIKETGEVRTVPDLVKIVRFSYTCWSESWKMHMSLYRRGYISVMGVASCLCNSLS